MIFVAPYRMILRVDEMFCGVHFRIKQADPVGVMIYGLLDCRHVDEGVGRGTQADVAQAQRFGQPQGASNKGSIPARYANKRPADLINVWR